MDSTALERLMTDPAERQALAVAIAQAIAAAPRPPLSATESAQRLVAIVGGSIGVLGVLVAAAGWAFNLQAAVGSVAEDMAETRSATVKLSDALTTIAADQWTRGDHERFQATTIADLETRIRGLEAKR
jgi:hypothetical protein